MKMDRRRLLKIALMGVASTSASGCVGGPEGSPDANTTDGGTADPEAEPAEFGYETWVPAGGYQRIAYADLGRLRDRRTLETDEETATLAGDAGPSFADVDGYISTDAENAYSGSFDAEALASGVSEALSAPEESEYNGYTVVRGGDEGGTVEVVVSDSFAVSSTQGEGGATGYVDAALGEAERAAEVSEPIQDLSEYVEDPLLVVFTPTAFSVRYRFIEATGGRLDYVEVTQPLNSEESRNRFLNKSPRRKGWNESTLTPFERNTTAEIRNNKTGVFSSPVDNIDFLMEEFFVDSGGSSSSVPGGSS